MERIDEILRELKESVSGIEGVVVARADGLVVASLIENADERHVAAMVATLVGTSQTVITTVKKGEFQEVIVNSSLGVIVAININDNLILSCIAKRDINLGLLLLEMRRVAKEIDKVIG